MGAQTLALLGAWATRSHLDSIDDSVESPIAASRNYACYGEPSPDLRASYLPHPATAEAKNKAQGFLRCSISLSWFFRVSPPKKIPNDHKAHQEHAYRCRGRHVRNKHVRGKYAKRQIYVGGPTISEAVLWSDQWPVPGALLAEPLFMSWQINPAR